MLEHVASEVTRSMVRDGESGGNEGGNLEEGLNSLEIDEAELFEFQEVGKGQILTPDIDAIKNRPFESILEENKEIMQKMADTVREVEAGMELRPLTEEEKRSIKEATGMTDANIDKCTINEDGLIRLKCINEEYAGKVHPETGVPYVEKVVDINGVKIQVVVPEFPNTVEVMLPEGLKMANESKQFEHLNQWLKEEIKVNPELRAQFSDIQIAMIEQGDKPRGFTWHHTEECCKMQLVKFELHDGTRHTGGNSIWSGGN